MLSPEEISLIIRRGEEIALENMDTLDEQGITTITGTYKRAAKDVKEIIDGHSDGGRVDLSSMRLLLKQIDARLEQLAQSASEVTNEHIEKAAASGSGVVKGVIEADTLTAVAHDAVKFTHEFQASDGLALSERLWKVGQGAREIVGRAVQTGIILGMDAWEASQRLIQDGEPVPGHLKDTMKKASGESLQKATAGALLKDPGNALSKVIRVMRTEGVRAHSKAYEYAAQQVPGAVGQRFNLSALHTVKDICDEHAAADRYGMGAGIYPFGKIPLPAHPNTRSYATTVFVDEVGSNGEPGNVREDVEMQRDVAPKTARNPARAAPIKAKATARKNTAGLKKKTSPAKKPPRSGGNSLIHSLYQNYRNRDAALALSRAIRKPLAESGVGDMIDLGDKALALDSKMSEVIRKSGPVTPDEFVELKDGVEKLLGNISLDNVHAARFIRGSAFGDKIDPKKLPSVKDHIADFVAIFGDDAVKSLREFDYKSQRAAATSTKVYVGKGSRKSLFHEMGHHLEISNPDILRISKEYQARHRTSSEPRKLSDITGNKRYRDDELAYEGNYPSHYLGKTYEHKGVPYTEVMSMGAQRLADPANLARALTSDNAAERELAKMIMGVAVKANHSRRGS